MSLRRRGVRAFLANSRPNDGTVRLASAARRMSPYVRWCSATRTRLGELPAPIPRASPGPMEPGSSVSRHRRRRH